MLKRNCSVIVATKLCILKILLWFYVTLKENPRNFLNECNITMKIQHWREILYLSHCINGKYLWAFEGISIHNSDADIKMNSRSEFHQPAVPRVAMTNEVHERAHGSWLYNAEHICNFSPDWFLCFIVLPYLICFHFPKSQIIPNHTTHILSQIISIDKVTLITKTFLK